MINTVHAHDNNDFGFHHMDTWGMGGGSFAMLLFWLVVIIGIILLIRMFTSSANNGGDKKSAVDILEERYAKGEINKEEFQEKKKDLTSK